MDRALPTLRRSTSVQFHEGVLAALILAGALSAAFARSTMAAVLSLGVVGYGVAVMYALLGAPDLAMTQFAVETLTVVIFVLVFSHLRGFADLSSRFVRVRDAFVAIAVGALVTTLVLFIGSSGTTSRLSKYFAEVAPGQGHGSNVVNVILVDFRGFDTLGEITVVGIVALTVYKLLRRFRPAPESIALSRADPHDAGDTARPVENQALPVGYMMVPAVLGRLLLPIAGVVSIFFLLRGHDAPGGGFVGGLVVATAFIVQYMVNGTLWLESRIRIHPQYWIGTGLLCAAGAGAGAWLASRNFLASMRWDLRLLSMDVHLSSTLLFDLGVYLLVVGSTILIVIALAHQSMRTRREPLPEDAVTKVWHAPETASGGAP
jgi:multicomponent K+:H+ antiporter subunit A